MKEVDRSELPAGQRAELNSAFGEDATVIELEPEDLEETEPTEYDMADMLEEGDEFSYETRSGRVISGTVTKVLSYAVEFDPDQDVCGYVGFDSFGGNRGPQLELLTINGEEA